ncbi:hypothetical protein N7470_001113 [Penicillium chermesinum]|nr:hypothetical protein N7470_001113 [Penicillium chermesinum]
MATPTGNDANLTAKRLNVLVYSGTGTTVDSVRHCLYTLRRLLAPNYAVTPVTGDMLLKEPWLGTCALLVIPGGADLGYGRTLNGAGNRRIAQFVRRVGNTWGFVRVGDRELGFFPGTCRGGAFPGFVYHSEAGARAAELSVSKEALSVGVLPEQFHSYYNGGGVFVDAAKFKEQGVEVLANYAERLNVDPGEEGAAAVVYCKVGDGAAVLTGPHPEFAAVNLDPKAGGPEFADVVKTIAADDKGRADFLKACLSKLGLQVAENDNAIPSLSSLHISGLKPEGPIETLALLAPDLEKEDDNEYLRDENDKFRIERPGAWNLDDLAKSLPQESSPGEGIVDYQAIIKRLVFHDDLPSSKLTPYFNHDAFYANLRHYQSESRLGASEFGTNLMYGEVVTSTNTILEKNTKLLRRLPNGFTATATVQVAGRGRGSNVWISPAGALIFSTVVRHPIEKIQSAPVVFIQYLAAMAIVKGIKSYAKGYEQIPVKLKWPNDVYALDPADPEQKRYTKICGILINSHFMSNEYISVVGIGLNATNVSPTTALTALAARYAAPGAAAAFPVTLEKLLARILTTFEDLYTRFLRTGFDRTFEEMYYEDWLHMHQIVTLEEEGGARARIQGITRDYGLLLAQELGFGDRPTGRVWQLQSDSNSFDFFRGLVKRKV